MKYLLILLLTIFGFCNAGTFYSNMEAKQFLRDCGAKYSDFIMDAKVIISDGMQVKGSGGLCIDLPIYAYIHPQNVILLSGASGYQTNSGSVIIEADYLTISAVVIKKYLIIGQDLKDIANYLVNLQ